MTSETLHILFRIGAIILGYLIGNFTTGYFLGKMKNVDLQHEGSGNVGTTNSLRVMGKRAAAVTLIVDALKGVLAMFIVYFALRNYVDYIGVYMIYAGVGAIVGHDFPVFLKFKGGKGIATSAGLVIVMFPKIFIIAVSLFILTVIFTKYVSLGSLIGSIAYGVLVVLFGQLGWLVGNVDWLAYPTEYLPEVYIVMLLATALAIFQHRSNIGRLIRHEENKISFKSKKKTVEE